MKPGPARPRYKGAERESMSERGEAAARRAKSAGGGGGVGRKDKTKESRGKKARASEADTHESRGTGRLSQRPVMCVGRVCRARALGYIKCLARAARPPRKYCPALIERPLIGRGARGPDFCPGGSRPCIMHISRGGARGGGGRRQKDAEARGSTYVSRARPPGRNSARAFERGVRASPDAIEGGR